MPGSATRLVWVGGEQRSSSTSTTLCMLLLLAPPSDVLPVGCGRPVARCSPTAAPEGATSGWAPSPAGDFASLATPAALLPARDGASATRLQKLRTSTKPEPVDSSSSAPAALPPGWLVVSLAPAADDGVRVERASALGECRDAGAAPGGQAVVRAAGATQAATERPSQVATEQPPALLASESDAGSARRNEGQLASEDGGETLR